MLKNTASQSIALFAFDTTTGAPKTGDAANMVFYITKDWGSVTAIAANSGVPTEMDSTNAKGSYKIAVSQTETNADLVYLSGKSSTANVSVVAAMIQTVPAGFTGLTISAGAVTVGTNNDKTGYTASTVSDKTGYTVSTVSDKTGYALTAGERNSVADALLDRDMSTGADSGSPSVRTVRQALRFLRNKWSISGSALTVTKEDDSTSSWTATLTTTPGASPITTVDPA